MEKTTRPSHVDADEFALLQQRNECIADQAREFEACTADEVRAAGRQYPIVMPPDSNDARFTIGLMLEVGAELERRGYPKLTGLDFVELQQSLFRFLYKVAP